MVIRKERKSDYKNVYELIKEAFLNAEHKDGNEQDLVELLREGDSFVPELSLVAEIEEELIGHIMLTEAKVDKEIVLLVAPLSVKVQYQGQGIGQKLLREAHKIAQNMGYEIVALVGHENYYPKVGYERASNFGIKCDMDIPDENFMAINLKGEKRILNGVIELAKEFRQL